MEQDATQLIEQRISELPLDVRNAVQSADLSQKIRDVGNKHSLHIDQIGELEDEVLLAMLGFSPLESLGGRLSQVLRIDTAAGGALAEDISTNIFGPIRESMKKFLAERQKAAEPAAPAPSAPSAVANVPAPVSAPAPMPAKPSVVATPPATQPVKPPVAPDLHRADVMLTQKTVDMPPKVPEPKAAAPAPSVASPIYKVDPYREPI